jgi:hypothetical protein
VIKKGTYIGLAAIICSIIFFIIHSMNQTEESIIYFPIHPTADFPSAYTKLQLKTGKVHQAYNVSWEIQSFLSKKAYLRQDISLLFVNGRLRGTLNKWKEQTQKINVHDEYIGNGSAFLQAISFHYAELHHNNNEFRSAQEMSSDHLFVIDSDKIPLFSFRTPENPIEVKWANTLTGYTNKQLKTVAERAFQKYHLQPNAYVQIPLTDLAAYSHMKLPHFSLSQSKTIIGRLWEGLYKHYFLGIKKENGTIEDPIDSTIPLILLPKTGNALYIVFETKDGELVSLKQIIIP